jgi:hypothetical protein
LSRCENLEFRGDANFVPDVMHRVVLQEQCRQLFCPSSAYAGRTERSEIDWIGVQNPA